MKMSKLTTGQIKTSPKPFTHTSKPEKIAKKMPIKVIKKKKIPRSTMPNISGVETTAMRNKGTGINEEGVQRKALRMRQGL